MPLPGSSDEPNRGLERTVHQLRSGGPAIGGADTLRAGIHTRGYLPHVKREGASYFVTFRLADSLPAGTLLLLERERAERLRLLEQKVQRSEETSDSEELIARDLQRRIERFLDRGFGACYLGRANIADIVAHSLRYFHGQRYLLRSWVVMPNHVHAVVWPMPNSQLSEVLKSWKQFTSRAAKRALGLGDEPFWQRESYDHWIRSDGENARIARYIVNNPVLAKLCTRPEDWRWSSAYEPSGRPT